MIERIEFETDRIPLTAIAFLSHAHSSLRYTDQCSAMFSCACAPLARHDLYDQHASTSTHPFLIPISMITDLRPASFSRSNTRLVFFRLWRSSVSACVVSLGVHPAPSRVGQAWPSYNFEILADCAVLLKQQGAALITLAV
jgi:hypothetical protein